MNPFRSLVPHLYSPTRLILSLYILFTLILTYPLPLRLATTVPNDIGDPLLNTWILAWTGHALLTDPANLFNANIFYPLPNTLAYSEHLFSPALLGLPLQLSVGEPIVVYNLSLLASFPLAALGMYLLTLRWTGHRAAAFVAGFIFAFNPYRFAAIAHLQLLTWQWLPFALLYLDRILITDDPDSTRPDRRPASNLPILKLQPLARPGQVSHSPTLPLPYLLFTLFLTLQLLVSWYLAVYTLFMVGFYLLVALFTRRLRRPWPLLASGLLALVLVLPLAWPYLAVVDQLRQARPLSLALSLAAAPTDFLAAAPFNQLFGSLTERFRARPGFTEENTLFLGIIAPGLALIAILTWFSRPQAIPYESSRYSKPSLITCYLLLTLCLSLLLTFPAPYTALVTLFPPGSIIRVPARWIIPATFALAALAAFGYTFIAPRLPIYLSRLTFYVLRFTFFTQPLLLFLTITLLSLETLSVPLPLAPVDNQSRLNPAYTWLAGRSGPLALVELPLHSAPAPEYPEVKRLYASTQGWWRLVNGYSGYTPPRQPALARSLAHFPGQAALTSLQNLAATPRPAFLPAPPPLYLLIHPGEAPFERSRWETMDRWQTERHPALWPIGEFAGDYLYQVLPPNPDRFDEPVANFGPNQTIQLVAYALRLPPDYPQPSLSLYWQTTAFLTGDLTVFIHLRARDGFIHSQADGPPVQGHYATSAWLPGQIIQDIHPLPGEDWSRIDHLAVGLYEPVTGRRLPAFDAAGRRLADEAVPIPRP